MIDIEGMMELFKKLFKNCPQFITMASNILGSNVVTCATSFIKDVLFTVHVLITLQNSSNSHRSP